MRTPSNLVSSLEYGTFFWTRSAEAESDKASKEKEASVFMVAKIGLIGGGARLFERRLFSLFPKWRREFDDAAIEGGEEAIIVWRVGVDFAAGKGAKGRKNELVLAKIKDRGAKAGAGAVLDADGGVEVSADVKAGGVVEFVVGIMKNVKSVAALIGKKGDVFAEGAAATGGVVVSFDESDGNRCVGEPRKKDVEDFGGAANASV